MTTAVTTFVKTGSNLEFVHFHGVDSPPRLRYSRCTSEQHPPVIQTAISHRTLAEPSAKLNAFAAWLLERAGLSASNYRTTPLHRRLPAVMRRLRVHSPEAAQRLLEANPELLPGALSSLLIGVSSFFRDTKFFDYVREYVLPSLLQSRRGVNVMSAGASNGCELYSIAILLAEMGALDDSSLLGIDCRPDAVDQASQGRFQESELSAMNKNRRERYFRTEGRTCQANGAMCQAIQWQCADLTTFTPPTSDLVLFRNVAIYLEEDPAASIWDKLCSALTPGGFLLTGKAEKPPTSLPLQCVSASVYRRKDATS